MKRAADSEFSGEGKTSSLKCRALCQGELETLISPYEQSLHNISYQTLTTVYYFAAGVTGTTETLPSSSATLALAIEPGWSFTYSL